jgi:hypothetical protein
MLPPTTTEEGVARGITETLRSLWAQQTISLPKKFEVVLCHQVNLPQRWFVTVHAGVLFPREVQPLLYRSHKSC